MFKNLQFIREKYKQFISNSNEDHDFSRQETSPPPLMNSPPLVLKHAQKSIPRPASRSRDKSVERTPPATLNIPDKQLQQMSFIDNIYQKLVVNKSEQRKEQRSKDRQLQAEAKRSIERIQLDQKNSVVGQAWKTTSNAAASRNVALTQDSFSANSHLKKPIQNTILSE